MKVYPSKLTDPDKKKKNEASSSKKDESGRDSEKYVKFRKEDKSGRSKNLTGFKKEGQYAMGTGPRTGGTVKKSTSVASGTGSKKVIKKSVKAIKRGDGSKQAKLAALRAHKG